MSKDTTTVPLTRKRRQAEYLGAALMLASLSGYDEITELLQRNQCQKAFSEAAYKGYTDIVQLLLPVSNPKAMDSYPL
jgi:hypothetical protein